MDSNTQRILESVTHKTLHAHAFSRSSSQATLVLTDLLSRYLSLLTASCGRYAEHAGRTHISIHDALQAMGELGTSVDELHEYGSVEGKDMNRYSQQSARRIEELNEFRSQLYEGLRQDRDDAIPLHYARLTEEHLQDSDVESEYGESDDEEAMDVDSIAGQPQGHKRKAETPPLPPSPISNSPSPPSRKRARISNWSPPEHIPDFLPPFPSSELALPPESAHPSPRSQALELPPVNPDALSQSLTSTDPTPASGDMLTIVPYSQSRLALLPERHLPSAQPPPPPTKQPRFPVPLVEPSFLGGFHYILTHPPPEHPPPFTAQRHKVSMALLHEIQNNSRWTPADTLFASVSPCPPRVGTMAPSHPVAIQDLGPDGKPRDREGKEDKSKFPTITMSQRPVSYAERLSPMASLSSSHIPNLAKTVLHPTILTRTTRLHHPPLLYRGTKPLVYGQGIPAPWNTAPLPPTDSNVPSTPLTSSTKLSFLNGNTGTKPRDILNSKNRESINGKGKEREKDPSYLPPSFAAIKDSPMPAAKKNDGEAKPPMPDARLFATWDYESKDYRVPMHVGSGGGGGRNNRGRMGSLNLNIGGPGGGASGSGVITLPNVRGKHSK